MEVVGAKPEVHLTAQNVEAAEWIIHRYLVKRSQPSFYPKGVSNEVSTAYRDGEWVVARDGAGQWFIPFKGNKDVSREQLTKEAFAWRKEVYKIQKQQRRQENTPGYAGEALAKTWNGKSGSGK